MRACFDKQPFTVSPFCQDAKQLFQSNYFFCAFFPFFLTITLVPPLLRDEQILQGYIKLQVQIEHFSREQEPSFCLLRSRGAPFRLQQVKLFISGRTCLCESGEQQSSQNVVLSASLYELHLEIAIQNILFCIVNLK